MRYEHKKVSRIVDELTTFFLDHKARQIDLKVEIQEDREIIRMQVSPIDHMEQVVEDLQQMLSFPRESEMEEYYWELAGEYDYSGESSELCIIGSMIDSASIDYDDDELCLELVRKRK